MDSAIAYEKNAKDFMQARSNCGYKVIRQWADSLEPESEVLEIACGSGYPVTKELVESGLKLWAIDSSNTLINEFTKNFPDVHVKCERFQDSDFFNRTYDAVVAIGLIFLLPEKEQNQFLSKVSWLLKPGGKFVFTAPTEIGNWQDLNTGITCTSLGHEKYQRLLANSGLKIISTFVDVGKNNYYETEKLA